MKYKESLRTLPLQLIQIIVCFNTLQSVGGEGIGKSLKYSSMVDWRNSQSKTDHYMLANILKVSTLLPQCHHHWYDFLLRGSSSWKISGVHGPWACGRRKKVWGNVPKKFFGHSFFPKKMPFLSRDCPLIYNTKILCN